MQQDASEDRRIGIQEILAIARRRFWWIVAPVLLGPAVGFLISLKITPVYTSQSFVLVEQQKVPDTFVPSMITDQLETRLMTMQDQILSRSRLQPIIEHFGLYKNDRGQSSMDELVGRLRKAIKVTPLRPDSSNALRGFYVAVDSDSPATAQKVCEQVLSMFMEENLNARSKRAQDTTDFLTEQLRDAKGRLDENDAKLAAFKSRYMGRLPTDEQSNLQMLATLSTRLDAVNEAIAQAQQQKVMQSSLLSQHRVDASRTRDGGEKPSELQKQLSALQAQLAALEARYTPQHPEVVKTRKQIEVARQQLSAANSATPEPNAGLSNPAVDTPDTAQLRASLQAIEESLKTKRAEQVRLEQQIASFEARIQLSPTVEEQFKALTRDYESALQFYNDLLTKKTQSEMVRDLEQRREGEQFRVMDAPSSPSKPSFPDRTKFALAGLLAGFGLGIVLAAVLEMKEHTIRTDKEIATQIGIPVLAVIYTLDFNKQ